MGFRERPVAGVVPEGRAKGGIKVIEVIKVFYFVVLGFAKEPCT